MNDLQGQVDSLEHRLRSDAADLTPPANEDRVRRVMRLIEQEDGAFESFAPPARFSRGRFMIPAMAAAMALAITPIVIVSMRPTPPLSQAPATPTPVSLKSILTDFQLPDLPDSPPQEFAWFLKLATPNGFASQKEALVREGRALAEHFAQAIPASLRSFDEPTPKPPDEPDEQTGQLKSSASSEA